MAPRFPSARLKVKAIARSDWTLYVTWSGNVIVVDHVVQEVSPLSARTVVEVPGWLDESETRMTLHTYTYRVESWVQTVQWALALDKRLVVHPVLLTSNNNFGEGFKLLNFGHFWSLQLLISSRPVA